MSPERLKSKKKNNNNNNKNISSIYKKFRLEKFVLWLAKKIKHNFEITENIISCASVFLGQWI